MESSLLHKAADFMLARRRRKRWQKIVSCMASVVVFCTTYALILPAITMSDDVICGLEEHAHDEACWTTEIRYPQSSMACTFEAVGAVAHEHDSLCRSEDGTLICTLERVALHQHAEDCWEEVKTLTCSETEELGHTHSDACYTKIQGEMTCTQAEDVGHSHGETCYQVSSELTCTDEGEEHSHEAGCYTQNRTLTCQEEERPGHAHDDSCYSWTQEQSCTEEERPAGHVHGDECYQTETVLTCEQEELVLHTHEADCYDEAGTLTCELPEVAAHQHTTDCIIPAEGEPWEEQVLVCELEVHSHLSTCYPAEEQEYPCGLVEHLHEDACRDAEGNLICEQQEHTHTDACNGLSEEEQAQVDAVITMIDQLPTYEEMEATLLAYEEAEDMASYEEYFIEIGQSGLKAYNAYTALTEEQQACVTNIDRLMDLSSVWSVATLEGTVEPETYDYKPLDYAAENTTIHLFDYGPYINTWVSNGQALLPFYRIWPEYSFTVDGEASWDHDDVNGGRHGQIDGFAPILETKLGSDGYPVVNRGADGTVKGTSWHVIKGSLRYLFDPNYAGGSLFTKKDWLQNIHANTSFSVPYTKDASGKAFQFRKAYFPVENDDGTGTGLFQRDEDGYWYYNSGKNAAWYNPKTEKFELYDYTVIPGHEAFANYGETTNGNFLPFNKGHVEGLTDYQTDESKVHDNDPDTSDGTVFWNHRIKEKPAGVKKENFRLITSDRTNSVNVNFGMTVEFDFYMPKNGQINGKDMVFEFSGDDDVWVYIDDVLVLDIGGCHGKETGSINFADGTVTPPDADAGYYKNTTIKEMFTAAGASTAKFDGSTFDDYTVHHLKFFYMERGGNVSNCYLRFNMPQIDKNTINVTKALEPDQNVDLLGSPDYYFTVLELKNNVTNRLFIGPTSNGVSSVTGITTYKVKNPDGSYVMGEDGNVKVFTVGQYGIFSIKAGQTAVFENVPANAGNFYVQEMIKEEDWAQYPSFAVNSGNPQWSGVIGWDNRTYYPGSGTRGPGGYTWYGVSGPTTNADSDSSFIFEQQNRVDTGKLGKLSITKQLNAYNNALASPTYKINVEMGGEPLPKGTTYKVGSATRTVGFDSSGNSYVELAGGETAVISNILSGTQFRVWESEASANGHTVTYSNKSASGNGEDVQVTSSGVTGIIRVSDHVQLTVSNTQYGNTLNIPVTKRFTNFAGGPYTYNFTLTEMTPNGSNNWTAGEVLQTKSVRFTNGSEQSFNFEPLTYLKHNFTSLPAVKYYMVEETGETAPALDNTTQYLVEVTITENSATKGIQASITNILQRSSPQGSWQDLDTGVVFVNTLVGDLTVTKTVSGGTSAEPDTWFDFTLTLGDETTFVAEQTLRDGSVNRATVTAATHTFKLRHGDSITFKGIPVGTQWTVTEAANAGFIQSWTVGGASGTLTNPPTGTITTTGTQVAYTNTACYTLPETGGGGTGWYTLAGALLMMGATLLLYKDILRRKEDSPSTS